MKARTHFLRVINTCIAVAAIALVLTGCAGYRLGTMLPDKYKTIAIPTFKNNTEEPAIQDETTSATISEFQMDGSLRVTDVDKADTVLTVELEEFRMRPIRYSGERSRQANEYRAYIAASILLEDNVTGEVVMEHPSIQGAADLVVVGDLSSSKKTAIPKVSKDLAHRIVEKVVEVW